MYRPSYAHFKGNNTEGGGRLLPYKHYLKQGLLIELSVLEGEYEGRYRSQIEEVNENSVMVGAPIEGGQVVPLREGTEVLLILWDDSATYEIKTKVIKRQAEPLPVMSLSLSDSYRRIQRRSYVRVPAFYEIHYRVIDHRSGLGKPQKVTMLDLSGGGMRFQVREKLEKNTVLFVELTLPTVELKTQAVVRRVFEMDERGHYSVSVEFVDLPERDRDRIIRCVFDIQRAMRKKGLV